MAGFCGHGTELPDSMRDWKFLDKFCDCCLLKRAFVTCTVDGRS